MKWYLFKRYATPSFDFVESRGLWMMVMIIPVVAMSAWAMPEGALWFATTFAVIGVFTAPQRPTAFEAALPISGRDIASIRVLIALGTGLSTLAIAAIIVAMRGKEAPAPVQYLQAIAIVTLGVFLPRLVRPKQFGIAPSTTLSAVLVLGVATAASINYLPDGATLVWLSLVTVMAAATWWRLVPSSYQAAPIATNSRTSETRIAVSSEGAVWWKMVGRSLFTVHRLFIYALLIFGGATRQWWLLMFSGMTIEELWQRTRWMQSMPISLRQRFWLVYGPGALLPMIIMAVAMQIHIPQLEYAHNLSRRAPGTYRQEPGRVYFDSPTNVSLEYWNRAPNGVAPKIVAPWGETAEPYVIRVFNAVYYNPYTSRFTSTAKFTEWQFRRLTTAVYGFPVELKDYDPRAVQPKRMTETPRMLVLHVATVLLLFMMYLCIMGLGKIYRLWKHSTLIVIASQIVILSPMAFWLFVMERYGMQQSTPDILFPLFERQLLQFSAMLPSNVAVVAIVAALPILAMYALLRSQFDRSEVSGAIPTVTSR